MVAHGPRQRGNVRMGIFIGLKLVDGENLLIRP